MNKLIPIETIEKLSRDTDAKIRRIAMYACNKSSYDSSGQKCVHWGILDVGLEDDNKDVRFAAVDVIAALIERIISGETCKLPDISIIEKWASNEAPQIRRGIMQLCINDDNGIPWQVIEKCLQDNDKKVLDLAREACTWRLDIPFETIEKWAADANAKMRIAAMFSCKNRSNASAWQVIERGLKDSDASVRQAAQDACLGLNLQ